MFTEKSEFQILWVLIKATLLMVAIGASLFLGFDNFALLLPILLFLSFLYLLIYLIDENHEKIAFQAEKFASRFPILAFREKYSFLGVLSSLLILFNLFLFLLLWLNLSSCPFWCLLIFFLFLVGGIYVGILFGFASLFNQKRKRVFGVVGFWVHLISLALLSYLIFITIVKFLGMMFFGVDLSAKDRYTPQEKFQIVLLLEEMPPSIHNLKVEGEVQGWLTFMTLNYQADPQFFEMLGQREPLPNASHWDIPIHKVECRDASNPQKMCYHGIVFPFVHDITYWSKSKKVIHGVTGMRD